MTTPTATGSQTAPLTISEIKIRLIDPTPNGIIAFASCIVNGGLFLNNVEIHRGEEGGVYLRYPIGFSKNGGRHFYWNPLNRETGEQFDEAILGRLRAMGV